MRDIGRFRKQYQLTTGRQFMGVLLQPSNRVTGNDFTLPRRLLSVAGNCGLSVGEVAIIEGSKFLLAENGPSRAGFMTYKLFEVNRYLAWTRDVTSTDAVTGIAKQSGAPQDLGPIWCSLDALSKVQTPVKVDEQVFRLLTGAALQVGDLIDGRLKVMKVNLELGMTAAEVR